MPDLVSGNALASKARLSVHRLHTPSVVFARHRETFVYIALATLSYCQRVYVLYNEV